ncbi:MAG: type IX secretion system outer membrane channel protein PorV [Calditrichia bacterium]
MRHKIIIFISVFLLLMLTVGLYAGDADRIGTAAGVQVLVPVGARDLALGGADIANTSGLDAIYWNPAGLSLMKNTAGALFSTMTIFNDINVNYLAIGVKSGRFGTVGFSLKAFDFGDIPLTTVEDMDGASGRTFSPTFVTTGLTYSRMLTDAILVGATGKLIFESIPRASASAFAFDIGIQYHNLGRVQGLSLGLAVKNIGTNMQYSGSGMLAQATEKGSAFQDFRRRETSSDQLPANVELGLSYKRNIAENNSITVAGIFQNNNLDNDQYKFGAEYAYSDLIFLRGGYLLAQNVESENQLYTFTLGLGLHYKVGGTDLTLDYAFRDSQYFDGNNMFSLRIGF